MWRPDPDKERKMRITDATLANRVITSINESKARLGKLQTILSTGKRINKPSDDPLRISSALNLKGKLKDIDQYLRNVQTASTWIDLTTQTLSGVTDVLNNAKTIALRESNITSTPDSKRTSAQEVRNLKSQLLNLANTSYGGRYLFAGTKTLTQPLTEDGTYNGDEGEINLQIGEKQTLTINASGSEVFKGDEDIFSVLSDLESALENSDTQDINNQLERLKVCFQQVQRWQGEMGGRAKRVEISQNHLKDQMVSMNKLLSYTEDADIIKVSTELQSAGVAYQAALSAGRQILQYTLIQFWK